MMSKWLAYIISTLVFLLGFKCLIEAFRPLTNKEKFINEMDKKHSAINKRVKTSGIFYGFFFIIIAIYLLYTFKL
jgi:hypothetical protein